MNTPCWSAWWYKKLLVKCKCTNIAWKWHIIGIMSQIASAPKERSPKCTMLHWPVALQVPGRISGSNFPPRSQSWTFSVILYIATGLGYIGSRYEVCKHSLTHTQTCTQLHTGSHTHTHTHTHRVIVTPFPIPTTLSHLVRESPHICKHTYTHLFLPTPIILVILYLLHTFMCTYCFKASWHFGGGVFITNHI